MCLDLISRKLAVNLSKIVLCFYLLYETQSYKQCLSSYKCLSIIILLFLISWKLSVLFVKTWSVLWKCTLFSLMFLLIYQLPYWTKVMLLIFDSNFSLGTIVATFECVFPSYNFFLSVLQVTVRVVEHETDVSQRIGLISRFMNDSVCESLFVCACVCVCMGRLKYLMRNKS